MAIIIREDLKEYDELTDEQAEKAFNKFTVDYKESIEDYMGDFVFDEKTGIAYPEKRIEF